ncbi:MATE family efflux transporter [Enterococcus florum]|uniref:Probable multidrug resistance protein NorM n=1 Tax=Enterococcus florum TaxID=2480627 RepID=A0A4P5P3P2_9ENTE|nr:MATE family efflux transporter [Enterococcus florum]GCF92180.1 MATE family efflux transporter [Enterococcus florum]
MRLTKRYESAILNIPPTPMVYLRKVIPLKRSTEKKILKLAIPATIENLLQTLVGFIDTLMVSKIGLMAVTAVGVANSALNVYLAIFIALSVGASSLIARNIGAGTVKEAAKTARQSTVLAAVIGLLFGLVTIGFGRTILLLMGVSKDVLHYGLTFFVVVGGSAIFLSLLTVFGSVLRAIGDTTSPMKISILVNLMNIVIDYLLIFGIGPFPELGILGTAIGTVLSRILGCCLLFKKIQQTELAFERHSLFRMSDYRPLIQLSIPAALERLVMRLGQVIYFGLIVVIGAKTFAAHSIAGNIESFVYMPAYGLATAATTLVGSAVGANHFSEANRIAYLAAKFGVLFMSGLGVILFFGSPLFARLFTQDSAAIQQIIVALRIDAFNQPGLAISLITTGSLQGMGDTKTPLYSTIVGMWGIRIVGVVVFGQVLGWGIAGIWLSIGIDLYTRSLYLVYRFHKKSKNFVREERVLDKVSA